MSDEKHQQLVDQVISKIHWGSREQTVRLWLEEEKGISGPIADTIIEMALRQRAKSIRSRAFFSMIFASVAILVGGGLIAVEVMTGVYLIFRTILAAIVLVAGVVWFLKNLMRFISGRTTGPVD